MARYAAFLRGVSPSNLKMPDLQRAFAAAGFRAVRTLLSSGNVVFEAEKQPPRTLARRAEAGMKTTLGRVFGTIVWSIDDLDQLLRSDPFAAFDLPAEAKRVVTFLREPAQVRGLPIEEKGARLLAVQGTVAFTAYVRHPSGPVFMTLIERTFGSDVTTRTWNTVAKCARAGRE